MPEVHHLHHHLHHLHWTQAGLQQQFINNNLKSIKKHRLTRQREERGVRPDVQAFEFGQLLIYRHPQQSNWLFTSGKCLRINRRTTKCLEYDESDFLCQTWYTTPDTIISSSSSSVAVALLGWEDREAGRWRPQMLICSDEPQVAASEDQPSTILIVFVKIANCICLNCKVYLLRWDSGGSWWGSSKVNNRKGVKNSILYTS